MARPRLPRAPRRAQTARKTCPQHPGEHTAVEGTLADTPNQDLAAYDTSLAEHIALGRGGDYTRELQTEVTAERTRRAWQGTTPWARRTR